MAYCGFQTTPNFVAWIVFTACFVSGCIWLPIGGVWFSTCGYCYDQFGDKVPIGIENPTDEQKGCVGAATTWSLLFPTEATYPDARDYYWDWCVNSGPIAAIAAGAAVLGASLLVLIYFLFAKKPAEPASVAVKMGP